MSDSVWPRETSAEILARSEKDTAHFMRVIKREDPEMWSALQGSTADYDAWVLRQREKSDADVQ